MEPGNRCRNTHWVRSSELMFEFSSFEFAQRLQTGAGILRLRKFQVESFNWVARKSAPTESLSSRVLNGFAGVPLNRPSRSISQNCRMSSTVSPLHLSPFTSEHNRLAVEINYKAQLVNFTLTPAKTSGGFPIEVLSMIRWRISPIVQRDFDLER